MRIATLLDQIDSGSLLLPEFQRGFVWTRDKIRRFMRSLYLGYPVGGILLWEADISNVPVRGHRVRPSGLGALVLDGQQRLTTLYSLTRGKPPTFFDGDPDLFRGLHFHLDDERFQFFATAQDSPDSPWVDAGLLLRNGVESALDQVQRHPKHATMYLGRLNRLTQVVERALSVDLITGPEFDLDAIVDIFNQVNSGGTTLSKGDLVLARLCAHTPDARQLLRAQCDSLAANGYPIGQDLLLRCVTAVSTGRASLIALDSLPPDAFKYTLSRAPEYVESFLRAVSDQVGLDLEGGLPGRGALPVVARWYDSMSGTSTPQARDGLLYWYLRCVLQDHYGRSIETALNRDLAILDRDGLAGLLREVDREIGGSFQVEPHDLDGSTAGTRSYTLIHMLSKIRARGSAPNEARSRCGDELRPHHIFPKKWLRDLGWPAKDVNSNANVCFLPESISAQLERRPPNDPLAGLEELSAATLATHCIPEDRKLWQPHAYREFLGARQQLLAAALQEFLESLRPRRADLRRIDSNMSVA
ncbi:DUF262 domain-containing protein [Kribbella yunnanensis]|uniref:DUF262 domain-containing protein n=1 Tax=Kribbella yunnanensis TaxID=190194 RepID=A0ABN2HPS0_9ACTN